MRAYLVVVAVGRRDRGKRASEVEPVLLVPVQRRCDVRFRIRDEYALWTVLVVHVSRGTAAVLRAGDATDACKQ